jgi:[ribosomal protein S18]-alanine N-acetyltransferase
VIAPIADLDRLAALHAACFAAAWSRDSLAKLLAGPGVSAWVVDDAAFLILRTAADEAEVLSIGTRPEARRQGHGRALILHGAEIARSAGAARLFLEVADDNVAAVALYRSLGFAEVGRRRHYYDGRTDAIVLALAL